MVDVSGASNRELATLLQATGEVQQELFRRARLVRDEIMGREVVLRGVIEVSSFCQKRCRYCAMRSCNTVAERFRLSADEIFTIAEGIRECGIGTAFLQSGQDPRSDQMLESVIPRIREELDMDVLLCLGERPLAEYQRFSDLGAGAYILKFETANPAYYDELVGSPLEHRLQCIQWIRAAGMKVGTGNIVGLPRQTFADLVDDFRLALKIRPDFVSCAPFIPNQGTPLEDFPMGNLNSTLNMMAVWRIALGNVLIPSVSALEKLVPGGQTQGLLAGANVITINFTPPAAREKYAIYSKQRFVVSLEHALETIQAAGLSVSASFAANGCRGTSP
jgi:biotin synthase